MEKRVNLTRKSTLRAKDRPQANVDPRSDEFNCLAAYNSGAIGELMWMSAFKHAALNRAAPYAVSHVDIRHVGVHAVVRCVTGRAAELNAAYGFRGVDVCDRADVRAIASSRKVLAAETLKQVATPSSGYCFNDMSFADEVFSAVRQHLREVIQEQHSYVVVVKDSKEPSRCFIIEAADTQEWPSQPVVPKIAVSPQSIDCSQLVAAAEARNRRIDRRHD